ncbi:hypothetical protein BDQ17DRAFT_1549004 [Cyathus striatus]|nr:hypothetical protein BDQ17DRAFT_1549004 [Cyathus striatus]
MNDQSDAVKRGSTMRGGDVINALPYIQTGMNPIGRSASKPAALSQTNPIACEYIIWTLRVTKKGDVTGVTYDGTPPQRVFIGNEGRSFKFHPVQESFYHSTVGYAPYLFPSTATLNENLDSDHPALLIDEIVGFNPTTTTTRRTTSTTHRDTHAETRVDCRLPYPSFASPSPGPQPPLPSLPAERSVRAPSP